MNRRCVGRLDLLALAGVDEGPETKTTGSELMPVSVGHRPRVRGAATLTSMLGLATMLVVSIR